MKQLLHYFKASADELKLVTWPKNDDLLRLTTITVIFVIITSLLLGLIDFSFGAAYKWLLSLSV